MRPLLVLRPEPGAAATLARAIAAGFQAIAAPIFTIVPVAWDAPDAAQHDALMLTSANAVREAGSALAAYRHLPAYAVGETTAHALIDAGFAEVRAGSNDAASLVVTMAKDGITCPLHLAGREHRVLADAPFPMARRIVYAADPVAALSAAARAALARNAVVLLHSPRAAEVFAALLGEAGIDPATVAVAAISPAAAKGQWRKIAIAEAPHDAALLAAAARLCEKG
jgi:uroporphyrinogen-III synthase